MAATLSDELSALDAQLTPQLLPALQAYTRAAAAAGTRGCAASVSDWQAAEAAACSDLLQLFVTAGSLAACASATGVRTSVTLSAWMGGPLGGEPGAQAQAVWQLLSQHVITTLREADRAFLLGAVDRANGGMDATGACVRWGSPVVCLMSCLLH